MKRSKAEKIISLNYKIIKLEQEIVSLNILYESEVINHTNTTQLLLSKNKIIRDFKSAINEFVKS